MFKCDQLALGVGDTVFNNGCTGLCNYIPSLLGKTATIRRNWIMYNCAEYESTTHDWLPSSKKKLFSSVFTNSEYSDCDLVILLVGSHDGFLHEAENGKISPKDSFNNIKSIVEGLEMLGKLVVVSYIPNPDSWQLKKANLLNNSYEHVVNELLFTEFGHKSSKTVLGPRCDLSNFIYFRSDFYESSRPFFNKKVFFLSPSLKFKLSSHL
ncbi:hypothetical protein AYI69_g5880 [Smittium culicis]|uniref:SGNH hydrolase-type esterase domain-containing protein n=1 Tax=Smittium culicis TaxID=133412 RepID=A0A1R1Y2U4_9FUNG|nr:hypothetical protein AYI69_g5880 [Smittium culicis]